MKKQQFIQELEEKFTLEINKEYLGQEEKEEMTAYYEMVLNMMKRYLPENIIIN